MMWTFSPSPKLQSGCQLSTHVPPPLYIFTSYLEMTWPYATSPKHGHMTTRLNYCYGIRHSPLSVTHIGTQVSHLCGHQCARADLKTQEPGEQPSKPVRMHPYPPSTVFSLRPTSNKRLDNAHITSGHHSGVWIMESHTSTTVPPMTTPSPNHQMDATTPSSWLPSPPKSQPRNMSPSPDIPLAPPCS